MIANGLSPNTINKRLSAIRSLVKLAVAVGQCSFSLDAIASEKIERYRNTTGIDVESFKKVLGGCDRSTLAGKRDYAILRLLWDNGLRRSEVTKANVADFDADSPALWIRGKGRLNKERIDLTPQTRDAVLDYLRSRSSKLKGTDPLFASLSLASFGHRLTGEALRLIVQKYCAAAGIKKMMSIEIAKLTSAAK